jgi:hypothetical protein
VIPEDVPAICWVIIFPFLVIHGGCEFGVYLMPDP